MKAALIILPILVLGLQCPASEADVPTMRTSELKEKAVWLSEVTSYDLELTMSAGCMGLRLPFEVTHKALHPWYFATSFTSFITHKKFVCNRDSLWTSSTDFKTYAADPWIGMATSEDATLLLSDTLLQPPYPFDFLHQVLLPEEDLLYEYVANDTLEVNGKPRGCEVWHLVEDPPDQLSDRLWIDPELHVVLKTTGTAEMESGPATSFELTIKTLRINPRLQPEDFVFHPEPDFTRVSTRDKLMVSDSLEGETPADQELVDLDGQTVSTSDWRGKIVVLDFWATWCGPCLKGLPHLQELRREFGDNVLIVGVTDEPRAPVERFLRNHPLTYPILLDPGSRAKEAYRVTSIPALFILDAGGKVREQFVGLQAPEVIRNALGRLGEEPSGPPR